MDFNLTELGELNTLLLQYDDAADLSDNSVAVKSGKKWGVISLKGDTILNLQYDVIYKRDDYWVIGFKDKEKTEIGLADANGKVLVAPNPKTRDYYPISDDLLIGQTYDDWCFLYNTKGKEIFICDSCEYDIYPQTIFHMKDNHYMASISDDIWHRVTYNPETESCQLDSTIYCASRSGSSNVCAVMNEERKWGVIDTEGKTVVPFEYMDIYTYGDVIVVKNEDDKYGRYGKDGVDTYYDAFGATEGYSHALDGNTNIFFDKQGKEFFKTDDEVFWSIYSDGLFYTSHNLFDEKGNVILHVDDSIRIEYYKNGYIIYDVYGSGRGLMDKKGNTILSAGGGKVYIDIPEDSPILTIRKYTSIEGGDGEYILEETDIFDTENNNAAYIEFPIENFNSTGLARAEVAGRHLYVNSKGEFGIENFEEIKNELLAKMKQGQEEENDHIKQLILDIVQENGYYPEYIHNLTRKEDGLYSASFYIETKYSTIDFEVTGIKIENDEVVECLVTRTAARPKKDVSIPQSIDQLIMRRIGAIGY